MSKYSDELEVTYPTIGSLKEKTKEFKKNNPKEVREINNIKQEIKKMLY